LFVALRAVKAESVPASSRAVFFRCLYVAARRARVVVVVNTVSCWLGRFIDRIEFSYFWHFKFSYDMRMDFMRLTL
jgi:hypothetical protein